MKCQDFFKEYVACLFPNSILDESVIDAVINDEGLSYIEKQGLSFSNNDNHGAVQCISYFYDVYLEMGKQKQRAWLIDDCMFFMADKLGISYFEKVKHFEDFKRDIITRNLNHS